VVGQQQKDSEQMGIGNNCNQYVWVPNVELCCSSLKKNKNSIRTICLWHHSSRFDFKIHNESGKPIQVVVLQGRRFAHFAGILNAHPRGHGHGRPAAGGLASHRPTSREGV
jgi:hypothetical protein